MAGTNRLLPAVLTALLLTLLHANQIISELEMQQPKDVRPGSTHGFPSTVRMHEPILDEFSSTYPHVSRWLSRLGLRTPTTRFHEVPLYGGMVAVGEYYAKVKIGGQTLRVQIDTGSATLAVPVKECSNCKRGDMRYSIDDSNSGIAKHIGCNDEGCGANTCSPYGCGKCSARQACCANSDHEQCAFHLSFGDGSGAKGVLIRDELQWGDVKFPVTFGGIRSDSPDFERSQVDGILGMAYPTLACNPSCIKPTFESMMEKVKIKNMFSICITYDSGKIVLGDYDPILSTQAITWVPLDLSTPPSFYSFPLLGNLHVNDKELVLPEYSRAIVDSGTTLIVFSHATFDKFKKYLQRNFCDVPGLCGEESWFKPAHCTKMSDENRNKLPTLKFMVKGFNVTLGPSEYLINYASKGPEYWCVGIMALNAMSGGVDVIFGNTVMKKYVTVYDRENKRVGFAESDTHCGSGHKSGTLPVPKPGGGKNGTTTSGTKAPTTTAGDSTGGGGADPKTAGGPGICKEAKDCQSCVKVSGRKCRWDAVENKCDDGEPTLLMCTIDGFAGKLVYVVGGGLVAVVVIVVVVAAVVHSYRKRQGSVASGEEDGEVERPLRRNEVDTSAAFTVEDEEEGRMRE